MDELKMQNSLLLQLVSGLQRQINSKNRQNQILFQQYEQLGLDNQRLQAAFDQIRSQPDRLRTSSHSTQLSSRLSPFEIEIIDLKHKCTEYQTIITDLKGQLEQRGGANILLENELKNTKQQEERIKEELLPLRNQVLQLRQVLESKQKSLSQLTQYMNEQAERISDLTRSGILAIDNYEAKLTERDQIIQQLKKQKESFLQNRQKQQIEELKTIIQSKQQSISQLSQFLNIQNDKIIKLQSAFSQSSVKVLEEQKATLEQVITSKEQSISQLSSFLDSLSIKNRQMQQKIEKLQLELQQKNKIINDVQINDNTNIEIQTLRAHLSTKQDQLQRLNIKLNDSELQINKLRINLQQINKKYQIKRVRLQLLNSHNEIILPHQIMKQVQQQMIGSSNEIIDQNKKQLQRLSNQLLNLNEIISNKDQSLKDFTEFISQQTDKIIQLQKQIEGFNLIILQKQSEFNTILKSKQQSIKQLSQFLQEAYSKATQFQQKCATYESRGEEKLEQSMKVQQQTINKQNNEVESKVQINTQQLRNQIIELQILLANKCETIAELSQFMNQQGEQLDELRSKLEHTPQSVIKQIEEQMIVNELRQSIELKDRLIEERIEQIQKCNIVIQQLKQKSNMDINIHKIELDEKIEVINKLNQQIDYIKCEYQRYKASSERIVQQNNSKIAALQQNIDHLNSVKQNKDNNNIQQQYKNIIRDLQDTINNKTQTIAELSEYMNEQSLRIEQLQSKQQQNKQVNNNDELSQILKSKQQAIVQLTQFLQESYNKNSQLQSQLQEVKKQIEQFKNKQIVQQAKQQNNQQIECQIVNKSEVIQNLKIRIGQLMQQIKVTELKIGQLNEQYSKRLVQYDEKQSQYNRRILQKKQQLTIISGQLDELSQTLQNINNIVVQLQSQKQNMKNQISNRQQLLNNNQQKLNTINKDVEVLLKQKQILQLQVQTLKYQLNIQKQQKLSISNIDHTSNVKDDTQVVIELQNKIKQYEGYLNDKQQEMAAMMEVMESLQAEIQAKNDAIQQLQQNDSNPEIKQQNRILKQQITRLQECLKGKQVNSIKQVNIDVQEEILQQGDKLVQTYKSELLQMKVGGNLQAQIAGLGLDLNNIMQQNLEQNCEKLTVLQIIQQIFVYFQGEVNLIQVIRLIQQLKNSYLNETQSILKQNNELKDTTNNLLQINKSLVQQIQKLKIQIQQQKGIIIQKDINIRQYQQRIKCIENNYHQEMKQLRKSISGLKDQSPIISKQHYEQNQDIINKLQDQVIILKQQNHKNQAELEQLRANHNKKFVKELNNLLDSCTVNKEGEEQRDPKELQEEIQRITLQKDQLTVKCKDYEAQITLLQQQCIELATTLEKMSKQLLNQPQGQNSSHHQQGSVVVQKSNQPVKAEAELLSSLNAPSKKTKRQSIVLQNNALIEQAFKAQIEQLHGIISDKSIAIGELEETLLSMQKGYNNEIMGLRRNIAQLKSEAIALRKSLYQANPNAVDICQLIKDTFSQSDKDTQYFRPTFPVYANSFYAQPIQNNASYYSQVHRVKSNPKSDYQRYQPVQLSMGEKFMGRRCKQASPFSNFKEEVNLTGNGWQRGRIRRQ